MSIRGPATLDRLRGDVAWTITAPDEATVGEQIDLDVTAECTNGESRDTEWGPTDPRCAWDYQIRYRRPDGSNPTSDQFYTGTLDEGEQYANTHTYTPDQAGGFTFEVVRWAGPAVGGGYETLASTTVAIGEADASTVEVTNLSLSQQPGTQTVNATVTVENTVLTGDGETLTRYVQVTRDNESLGLEEVEVPAGGAKTIDIAITNVPAGQREFCANMD